MTGAPRYLPHGRIPVPSATRMRRIDAAADLLYRHYGGAFSRPELLKAAEAIVDALDGTAQGGPAIGISVGMTLQGLDEHARAIADIPPDYNHPEGDE